MARSGFRTGLLRGRLTAFFVAVTLGLPICVGAADTAPERESWGKSETYPVFLRIAVQSTLPASFVLETLQPTVEHLRRSLPHARIAVEKLPPAELYDVVRTQGVHAFVCDSGLFADLQTNGWAEQLAARMPADILDPSYVTGMAVVVRADDPAKALADLKGRRILSDSPENFGTWVIFEGELVRQSMSSDDFLKNAEFNEFIAPMPLERLAAGKGDAAVVPVCELEYAEKAGIVPKGAYRILEAKKPLAGRCSSTGPLFPGEIFAVASQVNGEAARSLSLALLDMPPTKSGSSWSLAMDFQRLKTLYRDLKRGPYAYLKERSLGNLWARYRQALSVAGIIILMLLLYTLHVRHLVAKRTAALTKALYEKVQSEAHEKAAREQLAALERAGIVSELSSMFAHEVRQPAAAVVAFAGALRMYAKSHFPNDALVAETTTRIEDEAAKVSDIVERVRSYAKGRSEPRRAMTVTEIVEAGLRSFRQSVTSSGVTVTQGKLPDVRVEADPLEMTLAVLNLLKNASQAMEAAGSARREIMLTAATAENALVRITIRDFGSGLDADALAALNRRGPHESMRKEGLGLGLMLVRTVLEGHGGQLIFENAFPGIAAVMTLPILKERNDS